MFYFNKVVNVYNSIFVIGLGIMDKIMYIFLKINYFFIINNICE